LVLRAISTVGWIVFGLFMFAIGLLVTALPFWIALELAD